MQFDREQKTRYFVECRRTRTVVVASRSLRRVDEFVRLQTLLRIEEETERTDRIKAEREFLVEQVNNYPPPPPA